jgi:hypothetical protein
MPVQKALSSCPLCYKGLLPEGLRLQGTQGHCREQDVKSARWHSLFLYPKVDLCSGLSPVPILPREIPCYAPTTLGRGLREGWGLT